MSMQEQIRDKLRSLFLLDYVMVENESHQHSSGKGGESHFKVTMVSSDFEGHSLISRHRLVQSVLVPFMSQIHALGLHTYTPKEWQERGEHSPDSPKCAGGSKS